MNKKNEKRKPKVNWLKRINSLRMMMNDKGFRKRHKHISRKHFPFFYDNIAIVQFAHNLDVSFQQENNMLVANIPIFDRVIKFILDRDVCFYLMCEQFLKKSTYNFILDKPVVVVDIGMNVGDSALFFAANPFVEKIYAYELMPQIYDRAIQNFHLNPEIAHKIEANKSGLGKEEQELELPYYDDFDIGNGAFNDNRSGLFGTSVPTKCEIKNVISELQKIVSMHPNTPLYLKVDTEGAEYEIFDAIFKDDLFNTIRYIALEYHFGIQNIIDILKKHSFEVIESFNGVDPGNKNNKVGVIQAVRVANA